MASSLPDFVRRSNPDGKMDSICTKCYSTVATSTWEADLDSAELCHHCESWRLEYFRKQVEQVDSSVETAKKSNVA